MSQNLRTPKQQAMVDRLVNQFGIDGSEVLFLDEKKPDRPWLRARPMAAIARKSGLFKVVRVEHEKYIAELKQVVYQGTVVDLEDRIYSLPGIATAIEAVSLAEDEKIRPDDLAESRALRSTLELAGFDPFDPTSVVSLGEFKTSEPRDVDSAIAQSRLMDLARIHILAKEKDLIIAGAGPDGKDDTSAYRQFLLDNYQVRTAAGFDALQRKSLIEALERYVVDEFAHLGEPETAVQ